MEYELTNIIYDNSEYELEIEIENIEIQDFSLEELTVLPSSEQQIITPTKPKTYYNKVIVEPITTENIEVISSNVDKIVTPTTGKFINQVLVKGDSNLVSENIKDGVSILGVDGSLDTKYSPRFISFRSYKGTELNQEIENLDTKNITDMSYMFDNCQNLREIDISNFNTDKITSISYMFDNCMILKNIKLFKIDTQNLRQMMQMFRDCRQITQIDLSNINVSNVIYTSGLFWNCYALEDVILPDFSQANISDFSYFLYNCHKITKFDISNLNISAINRTSNMFDGCRALTTLIINNPNLLIMSSTNMLKNTPIASGTGYVYVPDDMVETYKNATNWSTYASQIKGISELPEGA